MALISAPWPLYNRPSIQLGALKSYLAAHYPDLKISAMHWYLEVAAQLGYPVYTEISQRMWLAESVYAALLYPERSSEIKRRFQQLAADKKVKHRIAFSSLTRRVRQTTQRLINRVDWQALGLVGFSLSLSQMTASIYLIQCVKQKNPSVPVIIGGASLAGDGAQDLLTVFPEIDAVVVGEGELPLANVVDQLINGYSLEEIGPIQGLITRRRQTINPMVRSSQITDLNELPLPDYGEYFDRLPNLPPNRRFFPVLNAEMSRGCWWQKATSKGARKGCAFCNLNLQWQGYRTKRIERVVAEVDELTTTYQSLSVAFMDNVLPPKTSKMIFEQLANLQKEFNLFAEIRAGASWDTLNAMRNAGINELQIGIEALSTRLLKKLNKGVTCLDNIEIMKHCEELGIANVSNLITHFPGSDADDVADTLRALDFVLPFRPLKTVRFWLGRGSPVAENAQAYGLKTVFNHPNYAVLFPRDIVRRVRFMVQAYHGDLSRQHKLWRPVIKKVAKWQNSYDALRLTHGTKPLLRLQDGRDFLIISYRRTMDNLETHRLTGASRRIYLFCRQQRSLPAICRAFPKFGETGIKTFLKQMESKKLLFSENERYLSLAVSSRPR
jgi:ribosomal peptide maturation radical SAM protein 1